MSIFIKFICYGTFLFFYTQWMLPCWFCNCLYGSIWLRQIKSLGFIIVVRLRVNRNPPVLLKPIWVFFNLESPTKLILSCYKELCLNHSPNFLNAVARWDQDSFLPLISNSVDIRNHSMGHDIYHVGRLHHYSSGRAACLPFHGVDARVHSAGARVLVVGRGLSHLVIA